MASPQKRQHEDDSDELFGTQKSIKLEDKPPSLDDLFPPEGGLGPTHGFPGNDIMGEFGTNAPRNNDFDPLASSFKLDRPETPSELDITEVRKPVANIRPNLPSGPTTGASKPVGKPTSTKNTSDPDKLTDALYQSGFDVREEEAHLTSTTVLGHSRKQVSPYDAFLHPAQLSMFMGNVIGENGLRSGVENDMELLQLISAACETFMSSVLTDSVVLSRHRRRPIKTIEQYPTTQRSDVARALKDIATKQKDREERRSQKRLGMGLDQNEDDKHKAGAEETLHRAANATAAMMTSSKKKKKYSWMNAGSDNAAASLNAQLSKTDGGLRYREAREENGIVLRDLVGALQDRRMCVQNAITKGLAKMRD